MDFKGDRKRPRAGYVGGLRGHSGFEGLARTSLKTITELQCQKNLISRLYAGRLLFILRNDLASA